MDDCGGEALIVSGAIVTWPITREGQDQWKQLRPEDSVQAQDQGECHSEMAALPQVCLTYT